MALDLLEQAAELNGPSATRRHRLEHLEYITEDSIKRIAALGVTASLQPVHADPLLAFNWMAQLGHDHRCERAFTWSEFRDAGCKIALGTDAPTAPYEALPNLYVATNRKSALKPDMPWPPTGEAGRMIVEGGRQVFSLQDAIVGATKGAAYSCRMEDKLGSLAKGMAADFCVLAEDPFVNGTKGWCKGQQGVMETWVGGKRVYKRE
jgi:predicted amidohydrolase YtcJ